MDSYFKDIKFIQSEEVVDTYRYIEVQIQVKQPVVENPFTDVRIEGSMEDSGGNISVVEGFCDSQDGSLFKIRFMPLRPGEYKYRVVYSQFDGISSEYSGTFEAVNAGYKGILRNDPNYPWHFVWEGTGEHYFLNGTTCYYLMGFEDENVIRAAIDRLHGYKINRIRVLLYGRQEDNPWGAPIINCESYRMALNPWVAKFPKDITNPEFDLKRFNMAHWYKYERLLDYAREKDIIVSVIFHIGAQPLHTPFMETSEDEYRYYRYAAARLSAYSNINWDLGNEHDFHRNPRFWTPLLGSFLHDKDPYKHLCGCHNKVYLEYWYTWLGMQIMQLWDAGQNKYMLERRKEQADSGRIVPQIMEEYGYEGIADRKSGMRVADTRRRCAWEIYMAGGYQTNGEHVSTGTGTAEDTGGGWVNGRGDDSMVMLKSFVYMVDFFTSFQWWKTEPQNELITSYNYYRTKPLNYFTEARSRVTEFEAFCLTEPGKTYIFYLPVGGIIAARIKPGCYLVKCLNPRNGEVSVLADADGSSWESPEVADEEDWVFLLVRK